MFSEMFAAIGWLKENWWLVAAGAIAIFTMPYWFTTAVKFFTETKIGMAIGAAVVGLGGAFLLIKQRDEANYQRGRADAERAMRVKTPPKATKTAPKADWWTVKKPRA